MMDDTKDINPSAIQTEETNKGGEMTYMHYKKNQDATQGVPGQLYESKLNALILYRLLNDDKVKEFYLGSNLDGIGNMDDVCIKLIHEDYEKPLLIFIQAKHKENLKKGILDDDLFRPSDFYLKKGLDSFEKLKRKFNTIQDDVLYLDKLEVVIPHLIFYTPAVSETMPSTRIAKPKSSTINIVKNLISSRKANGKVFQLNVGDDDLDKLTSKVEKKYSISDRGVAKEFLNNLYFFTDQAQEDEVGMTLQNEIAENLAPRKSQLQLRPHAIFLNFYGKVHKWWLKTGNVHYLTKECKFLHYNLSDFVLDGYLSLIHYNYVSCLDLYSIQFHKKSMKTIEEKLLQEFKYETEPIKVNVFRLQTNWMVFTCIKLMNCLSSIKLENSSIAPKHRHSSYLDYNTVSKMSNTDFDILLREIKTTGIKILVVILNTPRQVSNERLENILNEFHMNVVLVTEDSQTIDVDNSHNIKVITDHIYGLVDIINKESILEYKIVVQGEKINLFKIIDSRSKHRFINAEILLKILNKERIELGRSLYNQHTKKDWHQKRSIALYTMENNELIKNKEYLHLDTLNDVDSQIVVITAEAGMGKTTLLSLLSAKTKTHYPETWIVKINLQDFSEDLNKWKNKRDINLVESMLLVCKAELNETLNDTFDLELSDSGNLKLINKTLQGASLLLLELIVEYFNESRIIFVFDGFDKMCPYYEGETVKVVQNLILKRNTSTNERPACGNRVWITSRPYNSAKHTLSTELAVPFSLAPLTQQEQKVFYKNYWQANISKKHMNFNNLNKQDVLKTIKSFLNNVLQNIQGLPLRVMYESAREYLQEEYDFTHTELNESPYYPGNEYTEALLLAGIPLYMKLYANYFVKCFKICVTNSTKSTVQNPEKYDFNVNTFKFFENFHKSKLYKTFHEGKDPYKPDCRLRYSDAKKKSIKQHKLLALLSIIDNINFKTYCKLTIIENGDRVPVFKDCASMLDDIKKVCEKVGLIDSVHNGVPRFVHQALAECYAVEFIADLLKSFGQIHSIDVLAVDFVINYLLDSKVGLMTFFDQKLKKDNVLNEVLSTSKNKEKIFEVLMKQNIESKNSLHKVLENGFREIARILVHSIVGKINTENITHVVKLIGGDFFIHAASLNYIDLLENVLFRIKEVEDFSTDYISKCIILPIQNAFVNDVTEKNKENIVGRLNMVGIRLEIKQSTGSESPAHKKEWYELIARSVKYEVHIDMY